MCKNVTIAALGRHPAVETVETLIPGLGHSGVERGFSNRSLLCIRRFTSATRPPLPVDSLTTLWTLLTLRRACILRAMK